MANARKKTTGTLTDRAYALLKQGILRGEYPEGSFLSEAEITAKLAIGRTPFREACSRLHSEQLLEVVPRRGYLVPELSFRAVRELLETRLILEGVAAELAAMRGDPAEAAELARLYQLTLKAAKHKDPRIDDLVESNREFHLQIARMAHNRELESLLRGVLERSARLVYLAARSSAELARDIETLLWPVVEAIRDRKPAAAHEAVVNDITRGQLNTFGHDLWSSQLADGPRRRHAK